MKVLMVADSICENGIGITVFRLYRSLVKNGIKCDVICYQDLEKCHNIKDEIENDGNHIYSIPSISQGPIKYIRNIKNICKTNRYDVIHIHTSLLIFLAAFAAKRAGVPVRIGHAHGAKFFNYPELVLKFLEPAGRFFNRKYCTNFVTCSQVSALYTFGTEAVLIPNYLPKEEILGITEDTIAKLRAQMIKPGDVVFGYMGCLDGQKNVIFLPSVIAKLNQIGLSSVLVLIGEGKMKDEIENECKRLKCEDNVLLLGKRDDCKALVQTFDYFISASKTEGMSLSMIEAQMAGKPCIVSSLIPDYSDLRIGLFKQIDGFNAKYWAGSIIESINSNLHPIAREDAISMIECNGFDEDTIMNKLIQAYQERT